MHVFWGLSIVAVTGTADVLEKLSSDPTFITFFRNVENTVIYHYLQKKQDHS
jgi:hypothetical protein